MNKVLEEISGEREINGSVFGERNHHDGTGENCFLFGRGTPGENTYKSLRDRAVEVNGWDDSSDRISFAGVLLEQVFEAVSKSDQDVLRGELLQCAAIAVEWVEKIDRDQLNTVPRKAEYLPGDLVKVHTTDRSCSEYNGSHGVVTYGPDGEGDRAGWLVSCGTGSLRCSSEELTLITRREDR